MGASLERTMADTRSDAKRDREGIGQDPNRSRNEPQGKDGGGSCVDGGGCAEHRNGKDGASR